MMNGGTPDPNDPFDLDDFIRQAMSQPSGTHGKSIRYRIDEHDDKFVISVAAPEPGVELKARATSGHFLEVTGEVRGNVSTNRIRVPEPFSPGDVETTENNGVLIVEIDRRTDTEPPDDPDSVS